MSVFVRAGELTFLLAMLACDGAAMEQWGRTPPPGAAAPAVDWESELGALCGVPRSTDKAEDREKLYAGLTWCGGKEITLHELAASAAPVLWFSRDEPLRDPARRRCDPGGLPEPWDSTCPGDKEGRVYYYVTGSRQARPRDLIRDANGESEGETKLDLKQRGKRSVFVNFLFYYHHDFGVNGHAQDLEGAQFEMYAECTGPRDRPCRLRIAGIKGLAHGLNWGSNRLKIRPTHWLLHHASASDTRLPATLLVEEGKHASCPDRNGDGHYTPGVDVNTLVNDAWGVRDSFGSGVFSRRYDAAQTKPRRPSDRVFPVLPSGAVFDALKARYGVAEWRPTDALGQYVLENACAGRKHCKIIKELPPPHGKSAEREPSSSELDPFRTRFGLWKKSMERLPFSVRHERGIALSVVPPYAITLPAVSWMATLRVTVRSDRAVLRAMNLLISPSVSRWFDWYAAFGGQRFPAPSGIESSFVSEAGLRLRFKPLWLDGNLPFVGIRLGVQFRELRAPRQPRLVLEWGSGFM